MSSLIIHVFNPPSRSASWPRETSICGATSRSTCQSLLLRSFFLQYIVACAACCACVCSALAGEVQRLALPCRCAACCLPVPRLLPVHPGLPAPHEHGCWPILLANFACPHVPTQLQPAPIACPRPSPAHPLPLVHVLARLYQPHPPVSRILLTKPRPTVMHPYPVQNSSLPACCILHRSICAWQPMQWLARVLPPASPPHAVFPLPCLPRVACRFYPTYTNLTTRPEGYESPAH